jgi:hypothetical protein
MHEVSISVRHGALWRAEGLAALHRCGQCDRARGLVDDASRRVAVLIVAAAARRGQLCHAKRFRTKHSVFQHQLSPCMCPEPVLANDDRFSIPKEENGAKKQKDRFRTSAAHSFRSSSLQRPRARPGLYLPNCWRSQLSVTVISAGWFCSPSHCEKSPPCLSFPDVRPEPVLVKRSL